MSKRVTKLSAEQQTTRESIYKSIYASITALEHISAKQSYRASFYNETERKFFATLYSDDRCRDNNKQKKATDIFCIIDVCVAVIETYFAFNEIVQNSDNKTETEKQTAESHANLLVKYDYDFNESTIAREHFVRFNLAESDERLDAILTAITVFAEAHKKQTAEAETEQTAETEQKEAEATADSDNKTAETETAEATAEAEQTATEQKQNSRQTARKTVRQKQTETAKAEKQKQKATARRKTAKTK